MHDHDGEDLEGSAPLLPVGVGVREHGGEERQQVDLLRLPLRRRWWWLLLLPVPLLARSVSFLSSHGSTLAVLPASLLLPAQVHRPGRQVPEQLVLLGVVLRRSRHAAQLAQEAQAASAARAPRGEGRVLGRQVLPPRHGGSEGGWILLFLGVGARRW